MATSRFPDLDAAPRGPVGPRLPGRGLARRHARVAQICAENGLVVVRGPLGVGKTYLAALAAQSLERHGDRAVWIGLEREMRANDVWTRVLRELGTDGLAPDPAAADPDGAGRRAAQLGAVRHAVERSERPVTLVLDDIDRVADPRLVPDVLTLAGSVHHLRLIVTTREVTPLESRVARARSSVTRIGPDLFLTAEDVAEILHDSEGAASETARRLVLTTGGHALGLRLLLLALEEVGLDPGLTDARRLQELLRRGVQELLDDSLSAADQLRLGLLTVPLNVTTDLASAVVGDEDAVTVLAEAENRGLGAWTGSTRELQGTSGGIFTFVPVFRLALRDRLRRERPEDEARAVRGVVVAGLAEGAFAVAGIAAVESARPELLEQVCRAAWMDLRDVDLDLLSHVLEPIQAWPSERFPTLALTFGMLFQQDSATRHRVDHYLNLAARGLEALDPADPAERAYLATIASMARRLQGRSEAAVELAAQALVHLRASDGERRSVGRGFLMRNIGTAFHVAGDDARARRLMEEAHALETPGSDSELLTGCLLALTIAWDGDIRRAEKIIRLHPRSAVAAQVLGPYAAGALLNARALIALERGDPLRLQVALAALDDLPPLLDDFRGLRTLVQVLAHLTRGEANEGLVTLTRARREPSHAQISPVWRARLDAVEHLVTWSYTGPAASSAPLPAEPPVPDLLTGLVHAAALIAADRVEDARPLVRKRPGHDDSDGEHLIREALLAVIALRDDDVEAVHRHLRVMSDGYHQGTRRGWLVLSRPDREALAAIVPGDVPYLLPEADDLMMPALPTATGTLTPRELVVLQHLVDGATIGAIAAALQVSANTVKTQTRSIYRKLPAGNRAEAITRAKDLGLL